MNRLDRSMLRVGQKIGVTSSHYRSTEAWKIGIVEKLTATQITVRLPGVMGNSYVERFMLSTGRMVGGSPYCCSSLCSAESAEEYNAAVTEINCRRNLVAKIRAVDFASIELRMLASVLDTLTNATKSEEK